MTEALSLSNEGITERQEGIALQIAARFCLLVSESVIAMPVQLLLLLIVMGGPWPAAAQMPPPAPAVVLQSAIEKEDVDGDLQAAMSIYEKVAADASAPRDVRAKALLHLAGCEEKLGKQAKRVYEKILRDYADQPAATLARRRLAAIKQQEHPAPPSAMTARRIEWTNLGQMGAGDTDGERATFQDSDGNVFYGDLGGRSRHMVFKSQPNLKSPFGWWATRDFSTIALALSSTSLGPTTVALIKMDGTGYRELLHDDQNEVIGNSLSKILATLDASWSWDNRYLAVVHGVIGGGGRLIVINASDGKYREVVRSDSDWILAVRFSPNGKYIAYETAPERPSEANRIEKSSGANRIYIVPFEGGEPHLVLEESTRLAPRKYCDLKDWTNDGRYLIATGIREGKSALYLLPIKDGLPSGPSEFVRFGEFEDGHTTMSGSLVYQDYSATSSDAEVYLGSLDFTGRINNWRKLDVWGGLNGKSPTPTFSPDGRRIAYRAGDADQKQTDLVVMDLSTGQQHVIYQSSQGNLLCRYSTKEPKVFCTLALRDENKTDLFSVDDQTGTVEKIAAVNGAKCLNQAPVDGKNFYLLDLAADKLSQVTRWNLDTQQETLIVPGPQSAGTLELPSADGRWMLHTSMEGDISSRPITGGDWKKLVSGGGRMLLSKNDSTRDGNWLLYSEFDALGKGTLLRVPIAGGPPELLGNLPNESFFGRFSASADGRGILGTNLSFHPYDLWVLENFVQVVKK